MRFGSCKLSKDIIDKIICSKEITSTEVSFLLLLSIIQSDRGMVEGLKYKEVCEKLAISHQEFYDCVYALEEQKFIRIVHRHNYNGWDIEILDNVFATQKDDQSKRYLRTNRDFLHTKEFIKLRTNVKKIILNIVFECRELTRDFFLHIARIKSLISINNVQLIKSYIKDIERFFKLTLSSKKGTKKQKNIIIIHRDNPIISDARSTQFELFVVRKLKLLFRTYKINFDEVPTEDIKDLIVLINQRKEYFGMTISVIIDTLISYGKIIPPLINKIITAKLEGQNF